MKVSISLHIIQWTDEQCLHLISAPYKLKNFSMKSLLRFRNISIIKRFTQAEISILNRESILKNNHGK